MPAHPAVPANTPPQQDFVLRQLKITHWPGLTGSPFAPDPLLGRTPLNLNRLGALLAQHPKPTKVKKFLNYLQFGHPLLCSSPPSTRWSHNLASATSNPQAALAKIEKEVKLGRVRGPFRNISDTGLPSLVISPIGLIPKAEGGFRLIHHLSHPWGRGINAFISDEDAHVSYARFDDAILFLTISGPNTLMAKVDVQSAYRLLPMRPSDHKYLGFQFLGQVYYDLMLPMGAKISAAHWEDFGNLWEWLISYHTNFQGNMCRYLDDLLLEFPPHLSLNQAQESLAEVLSLCSDIGLPLSKEKLVNPTTQLTFLGIAIDSTNQTLAIPTPKLLKAKHLIEIAIAKRKVQVHRILSIAGLLNFLCKALPPGRPFLRRLFDSVAGKHKRQWITLEPGCLSDLKTWLAFLEHFNGTTPFPPTVTLRASDIHLYTDASLTGYGIICGTHWVAETFPTPNQCPHSMTWREFYPILVATFTFPSQLSHKKICFVTDNLGVFHILRSLTSRAPDIMELVRPFVLQCLKMNTTFTSKYVPSARNSLADPLSRQEFQIFRSRAPWADTTPTPIPHHLKLS